MVGHVPANKFQACLLVSNLLMMRPVIRGYKGPIRAYSDYKKAMRGYKKAIRGYKKAIWVVKGAIGG